jgi:hypothetical protein
MGRLIHEISAEVEEGPAVYRPSRFWEIVSSINEAQLSARGFETFKRTINQELLQLVDRTSAGHPVPGSDLGMA